MIGRTVGLTCAVAAFLLVAATVGPDAAGDRAAASAAPAPTAAADGDAGDAGDASTAPAGADGAMSGDGDGTDRPAPAPAPAPSGPPSEPAPEPASEQAPEPDGSPEAAGGADGTRFTIAAVPSAGGVAGTGPRVRYTVEVAPGIDVDPDALAAEVRAALHDPRSWARDWTLEQVADPARARIRVVLADPTTVDLLCARAGLDTAGIYSCWNGTFAALNAWRWDNGADGFDDLAVYRTYLVNHEVGHGLGRGHVGCPAAGALAPVMMQQSKGLDDCRPNGWPYPTVADGDAAATAGVPGA